MERAPYDSVSGAEHIEHVVPSLARAVCHHLCGAVVQVAFRGPMHAKAGCEGASATASHGDLGLRKREEDVIGLEMAKECWLG